MKCAILNFLGSNGQHDAFYSLNNILGYETELINIDRTSNYKLEKYQLLVIPGGFSYGDYLRPGFFASLYLTKERLKKFLKNGGFILGICNGFQILTELKFLPGSLLKNHINRFISKFIYVKFNKSAFFNTEKNINENAILKLPIAHSNGNFFCSKEEYKNLKSNNQILFEYCSENGEIKNNTNPNGSMYNISGIINLDRNVLGIMPHPERSMESILGSQDGIFFFKWIHDIIKGS